MRKKFLSLYKFEPSGSSHKDPLAMHSGDVTSREQQLNWQVKPPNQSPSLLSICWVWEHQLTEALL